MIQSKDVTNPFPGLRPFEASEYRLFFGREGQSDALIARLQRSHFLAVVGTSGSGKSSLVRAGLLPALRGGMMAGAGSGWRICIMRPGSDPIGNLAIALADKDVLLEAGAGLSPAEAEAVIEATLRRGALGLVEAARQAHLNPHEKLMLVVDQFEELFRFRAARAASSTGDDASAFVKLLLEAAQQSELSIYVVPTMRSDFLGDCAQFQGLPEAINDGQYLIPRMTRDERRFAITGPVGVTRGKITEPLVNRLMNDVGDNPDQLPILQHALMRTWDYWSTHRRDGEPIGLEHYEAIGTMSDALSEHADEAFNELPDERSRLIAELLFKALTERGADNREIRRPTSLKDICAIANASPVEVGAVIDVFRKGGRSFLMPSAGTDLKPETVIDISHESLIRNWDRLQGWVDEEAQSARIYRRLAEAAVLHREGKEGLAIDPALQIALDWRAKHKPNAAWANRYHSEFNTAIAFLDASFENRNAEIAAQERARQEKIERDHRELEQAQLYAEQQRLYAEQQSRAAQRMRRFTFALVFISILAVAAAGTAAFAYNSARKSKNAANQSERKALEEKENAKAAQTNAERLAAALQTSKDDLETKRAELQKSVDDFRTSEEGRLQQTELAKERAAAAQKAEKKAKDEADNALKQAKKANDARKLAEGNAARAEYLKSGLEARQSGDDDLARMSFESLVSSLEETLAPSGNQLEKEVVRQLTIDLGWAHSNVGSAWLSVSNLASAKASYETARAILDQVWPKGGRAESEPGAILFQTYNGLGHTYHEIALEGYDVRNGRSEKIEPQTYFKNAEALFLEALKYYNKHLEEDQMQLKAVAERGVAEGYVNLAHLYRDMGATDKVEQNLKALVDLDRGGNEQIAALRELAEFYRTQNKNEQTLAAYNKLIDEQEKFDKFEEGYAKFGQEIANSYSELADVYRTQAEDNKSENPGKMSESIKKANDAFELSTALQRFSTRLRRWSTAPDLGSKDRDDLADNVADAYVKVGKFDRALALYDYALKIRTNGEAEDRASLGKSYDKLARFYRLQKDYGKATENYNKLIAFYRDNPRKGDYVATMLQVGSLYAEDPNASPDVAVSIYEEAGAISQQRGDWETEDIVYYRLARLYEKRNQPTQRAQALGKRVTALAKYIDQLLARKPIRPNKPITLVYEYLQAVNSLAYFHSGTNDTEAAGAYQRAYEARAYITDNISDEKVLKFYAAVLGDYQVLLNRLKNRTLAADVGKIAQGFRDKLSKAEESKLTKDGASAAAQ